MANSQKLLLLPLLLLVAAASPALRPAVASANVTFPLPDYCQTSCGGILVKYPFGFQDGCFRPGFKLFCNTSTQPHKLFLGDGTTQVFSAPSSGDWIQNGYIFIEPVTHVVNISSRDGASTTAREVSWTAGGAGGPYALSSSSEMSIVLENTFTVVGCGVHASLMDATGNVTYAGCTTVCIGEEMMDGLCGGAGCCQMRIPGDLQSYKIRVDVLNGTTQANSTTAVKIIAASDANQYQFKLQDLYDTGIIRGDGLMAALKWGIPDLICIEAEKDASNYACLSDHSECKDGGLGSLGGYTCSCLGDDDGNAYVPHGCKGRCTLGICNKAVLGIVIAAIVVLGLLFLVGLVVLINRKCNK